MGAHEFQACWDYYWSWEPNRRQIYRMVAREYACQSALYPGCGTDAIPSIYVPHVTYIDNSALATGFFRSGALRAKLERKKRYDGPCTFEYFEADYHTLSALPQVDLLISQYAGMVGQNMKQFLKLDGGLLVADGPPDADAAMDDPDYELLGTTRTGSEQEWIVPGYLPRAWIEIEGNRIPRNRNFCFQRKA